MASPNGRDAHVPGGGATDSGNHVTGTSGVHDSSRLASDAEVGHPE
jgi:hypothetical protein